MRDRRRPGSDDLRAEGHAHWPNNDGAMEGHACLIDPLPLPRNAHGGSKQADRETDSVCASSEFSRVVGET